MSWWPRVGVPLPELVALAIGQARLGSASSPFLLSGRIPAGSLPSNDSSEQTEVALRERVAHGGGAPHLVRVIPPFVPSDRRRRRWGPWPGPVHPEALEQVARPCEALEKAIGPDERKARSAGTASSTISVGQVSCPALPKFQPVHPRSHPRRGGRPGNRSRRHAAWGRRTRPRRCRRPNRRSCRPPCRGRSCRNATAGCRRTRNSSRN